MVGGCWVWKEARGTVKHLSFYRLIMMLGFIFMISTAHAQKHQKYLPDGTEGEVLTNPLIDSSTGTPPKRNWNEFNLGFTTLKLGAGFLYEYAGFEQDEPGQVQMDSAGVELKNTFKVRDFRLLFSGAFHTRLPISWKVGAMYDGVTGKWLVRESGFTIAAPALAGHIFIGRTKEGFSLNKVMNGYAGWTMERQMGLDVIPILADGIKFLGYLPKPRIFWNAGIFTDWFSEGQGFSTYDWQTAIRFGWRAVYDPSRQRVFHIGASYRYGHPYQSEMRLRSRPEANPAPYFIDTGQFPSDHSNHFGTEIYYTRGPLTMGSEILWHSFSSPSTDNPTFFGGDIAITYTLTGESRAYSSESSIYAFLPVEKPVFKGGWGTVEAVLRFSYLDLDDGASEGGKLWRITPMVNWYLSKYVRFEVGYGYSVLDRFNLKGVTQLFQSRIHFQIL